MGAEGKNEVARSLLDLQPTAMLELYKIYPDTVDSPSTFLSFHGGSVFGDNVIWQGVQYIPIPVESEGFGVFGDGTLPRPKIKISNSNNIVTYFLGKYKDFKNAKVFRKKVFVKHLDDANFDGANPFGLANSDSEISEEKYYIGQKIQENRSFVEFELNLPLDLDNFDVNHRTVNAKYCYWQYRGLGCQYKGLPVEKEDGKAFTDANGDFVTLIVGNDNEIEQSFYKSDVNYLVGNLAYIEDKSIIINDGGADGSLFHRTWYVCVKDHSGQNPEGNPSYWQKDGCNKKIEACHKRFCGKGLVKTFIGEEDATRDYLNLPQESAASLATKNPNVTGVFNGGNAAWTLSIWMRGDSQYVSGSDTYNPVVFATHELPRTNYKFSPYEDGTFDGSVMANLHFSDGVNDKGSYLELATNLYLSDPVKSKLTQINKNVTQKDRFSCFVFTKEGQSINYVVNPSKDQYGKPYYEAQGNIRIDESSNGVDLFSLFSDKTGALDKKICFGGDIAQACLWSGALSTDEVIWLGSSNSISDSEYYLDDNGLQKVSHAYYNYLPFDYSDATGYLTSLTGLTDKRKLVAWYDMQTGLSSDKFVVYDESPNGYDITGFGDTDDFEKRTIEYTKSKFEEYIANQNAAFALPFGGFPGTDGFDYKSV
jgi:lambda family phage minor tail protein L